MRKVSIEPADSLSMVIHRHRVRLRIVSIMVVSVRVVSGNGVRFMDKLKPYLPIILAAVFAVALFSFDATAYHNSANEIDVQKAVGLFASLWATLTVVLKMQPPGESK